MDKTAWGQCRDTPGWLMKGRMKGGEPPLPGPLLHKFVEEREKRPELSLHEPAVKKVRA
jgi:hypothetical protein